MDRKKTVKMCENEELMKLYNSIVLHFGLDKNPKIARVRAGIFDIFLRDIQYQKGRFNGRDGMYLLVGDNYGETGYMITNPRQVTLKKEGNVIILHRIDT